jgi:hypothetical protein
VTDVACYVVIQDSTSVINDPEVIANHPDDGDFLEYFDHFDAPDLKADLRPVLMFRVNPQMDDGEEVRLYIYLNDVVIVDITYNTGMHRSWHEVVEANVLRSSNNSMHAVALGRELHISDLVMMYRAEI